MACPPGELALEGGRCVAAGVAARDCGAGFETDRHEGCRAILPATGSLDVVRVYRSARRGVHALGDLRLRLRGRLGLVERQSRLEGHQEIAIEPAERQLLQAAFAAQRARQPREGLRLLRLAQGG